jgi:hypothetical protein
MAQRWDWGGNGFRRGTALTQVTVKIDGTQLMRSTRPLPTSSVTASLTTSLTALLWRATVLPRAVYGCEFHKMPAAVLRGPQCSGMAVLQRMPPLALGG